MKPNLERRYPRYKILKTIPADNFYAKFCMFFYDDTGVFDKAKAIFKQSEFSYLNPIIDEQNKKITFFKEVMFFAQCLFFDTFCGEEAPEFDDVETLPISELRKNYGDIYEDIHGFICEDIGGPDFNIILAQDVYQEEWFGFEKREVSIEFLGYVKRSNQHPELLEKNNG